MQWYSLAAIIFGGIVVLLLTTGMPIAFGIGVFAFGAMIFALGSFTKAISVVGVLTVDTWATLSFLTLPFFILLADFITRSGATDDLFDMASKWFGSMRGSLAVATIVAGALFGTLCGSSMAAAVTIGMVAMPQMLSRGYSKKLAAGSIAAGGGLAHMIPPSLMAIIYATLAELSPGKQLIAGFIPGILLAFSYIVTIFFIVRFDASSAPKVATVTSWSDKLKSLGKIMPVMTLATVVLVVIYFGIATATEAAAFGSLVAMVICIFKRRLSWHGLNEVLMTTTKSTCFVMAIVLSGAILSWLASYVALPQDMMRSILNLGISPWMVLIATQIIYLFLGCFLEGTSMLILTLPVVLPVIKALGFDPIWFGVLFLLNLEIGLITPPVGLVLYAIKGIAPKEVSLTDILGGSVPFLIACVFVLILIMVFPQIALWLPNLGMRG